MAMRIPMDNAPEHAAALGRMLAHWALVESWLTGLLGMLLAADQFRGAMVFDAFVSVKGKALPDVSSRLNYLVIGAEGNPCWAFACYGRKVEKAVQLRRKGARVVILHENDFHDAVLDA